LADGLTDCKTSGVNVEYGSPLSSGHGPFSIGRIHPDGALGG